MKVNKKIRPVIFGIRIKFFAVIAGSVSFALALTGFGLITLHEQNILSSYRVYGSNLLDNILQPAQQFLNARHRLRSEPPGLSPAVRALLVRQQQKAAEEMRDYLSTIIDFDANAYYEKAYLSKDGRLLDIAFLIDIEWKDNHRQRDPFVPWHTYFYFNRATGVMFVQKHGAGKIDPILAPSLASPFTRQIQTEPAISYADKSDIPVEYRRALFEKGGTGQEMPRYVFMGIPLFQSLADLYLYRQYLSLSAGERRWSMDEYRAVSRSLRETFSNRAMHYHPYLPCEVRIADDRDMERARALLYRLRRTDRATRLDLARLAEDFNNAVMARLSLSKTLSIDDLQSAMISTLRRNDVLPNPVPDALGRRVELYRLCKASGITCRIPLSLGELARISYRGDLHGILGMFFKREQINLQIERQRQSIINLMISIFLRALFIAFFFPAFIIRAVSTLADGANEIGKGNFDKRIELKGSDELGRLADIFNLMATNVKKGQEIRIEKIRMERELQTAAEIQEALLPREFPRVKGVAFGSYYAAQTEAGGDYYDVIDLGNGALGIAVADVSGHGVGSGLVMAMTRTLLHVHCRQHQDPRLVLDAINDYLKANTATTFFVTMFYGILNTTTLKMRYTSAGHCPPILVREKQTRTLSPGGIALGAAPHSVFMPLASTHETQLARGDSLILYTDGIEEAVNAEGEEFGLERFTEALRRNSSLPPEDMINASIRTLREFTGETPQHDDITILAVRILP